MSIFRYSCDWLAAGVVTAALCAAAVAPAHAETLRMRGPAPTDPVLQEAAAYRPPDQFTLYSDRDVETARFKTARLLSICAAPADPGAIDGTRHAVPLTVSYDGGATTVSPGGCAQVEARKVAIRPAGHIRQTDMLTGTVHVIG